MTAFGKRVDTLEARVTQLEEENGELKKRLENTDLNVKSASAFRKLESLNLNSILGERISRYLVCPKQQIMEVKKILLILLKIFFENRLQQTITTADILAAHRIPTRNKTQPRPITVKFLRPEAQESVLRSRRKLKGEPFSISDDLCVTMQNVLNRAKKTIGWKSPGVGKGKYSTNERVRKKLNSYGLVSL